MTTRLLVAAIVFALAAVTRAAPPEPIRPELKSALEPMVDLEMGWKDPPQMARTRCWWWWLNGNVTPEAITRDLEEMKAKGLGGANIIDAGGAEQRGNLQVPHGPDFGTPEWRKLFVHALAEADRLGLELGFNIQSGWNLGGPSVLPEESTKRLTWSEVNVTGGKGIEVELPAPAAIEGFYRDVAVVAFPLPGDAAVSCQLAASSTQGNQPLENMVDGKPETFWVSAGGQSGQGPAPDRPEWIELRFSAPVTADRFVLQGRPGYGPKQCRLEAAGTDGALGTLAEFTMAADERKVITFDQTTTTKLRLVVTAAFDPKSPASPRNVQIAEIAILLGDKPLDLAPNSAGRIDNFEQKAYYRYPGSFTATEAWHLLESPADEPGRAYPKRSDVVDLTAKMDASGTLQWDAPAGPWKVLRLGYTLAGSEVSTHSENGGGWAIDYLDARTFDAYWKRVMEPILEEAKPYVGRSLRYLHTDSWELGPVNWTAEMPREFRRLRGYDLLPMLPALAGYVVESQEYSTRFLNDFRRTLADLIAGSKYATFAAYAHQRGLGIHPESGGPHAAPIDALECLGRNDIPMGEFWARSATHRVEDWQRLFVKQSASAAHIYGKRLVLAEAFTTIGPHWEKDPRDLKPVFDQVACEGLNVTMLHTFDCSPAEMGLPGQAYFAGTHVNPQVTWWNQAGAFFAYLNRCHFLLQQGLPVSDVVYFYGENIPAFVRLKRDDPAGVLPGYDYDVINAEALLARASVRDGRIVLADGTSYRLLVMPDHDATTLKTLAHIATLVESGATLVGRKPQKPLGVGASPEDDAKFQALTAKLWGEGSADEPRENRVGEGRVISGKTARAVLEEEGTGPDFTFTGEKEDSLFDYFHRTTGEAEIYFVANRLERAEKAEVSFRITGRQPELWDPLTGEIRDARAFRQADGRTIVPLEFDPAGSMFVIFRRAIAADSAGDAARNQPVVSDLVPLEGPWKVRFDPRWGGPEVVEFEHLVSWTERPEEGIRFYSGAAVYEKMFDLPAAPGGENGRRVLLDLGEVKNLAQVWVNGKELGIAWTTPFRVDITEALRPAGNRLEIKVVNLWPNRLIGDQHLPPDQRRTKTNVTKFTKDSPLLPSGLLGPVKLLEAVK